MTRILYQRRLRDVSVSLSRPEAVMDANDPIISYSMHCVELPKRRVVHVVVQQTDLDAHRTVLWEKDFDLPPIDMRHAEWWQAMQGLCLEVEEAITEHRW